MYDYYEQGINTRREAAVIPLHQNVFRWTSQNGLNCCCAVSLHFQMLPITDLLHNFTWSTTKLYKCRRIKISYPEMHCSVVNRNRLGALLMTSCFQYMTFLTQKFQNMIYKPRKWEWYQSATHSALFQRPVSRWTWVNWLPLYFSFHLLYNSAYSQPLIRDQNVLRPILHYPISFSSDLSSVKIHLPSSTSMPHKVWSNRNHLYVLCSQIISICRSSSPKWLASIQTVLWALYFFSSCFFFCL